MAYISDLEVPHEFGRWQWRIFQLNIVDWVCFQSIGLSSRMRNQLEKFVSWLDTIQWTRSFLELTMHSVISSNVWILRVQLTEALYLVDWRCHIHLFELNVGAGYISSFRGVWTIVVHRKSHSFCSQVPKQFWVWNHQGFISFKFSSSRSVLAFTFMLIYIL